MSDEAILALARSARGGFQFPESWRLVAYAQPVALCLPTKCVFAHVDRGSRHVWTLRRHRLGRLPPNARPVPYRRILPGIKAPRDFRFFGYRRSYGYFQALLLIAGAAILLGASLWELVAVPNASPIATASLFAAGVFVIVVSNGLFFLNVISTPQIVEDYGADQHPPLEPKQKRRCWVPFFPKRLDYMSAVAALLGILLLLASTLTAIAAIAQLWDQPRATVAVRVPGLIGSLFFVLSFYLQLVENQHHLVGWDSHRMTNWELACLTLSAVVLVVAHILALASLLNPHVTDRVISAVFAASFAMLVVGGFLFYLETLN